MNFLDQIFLENTIRSYIIVTIVILLALLIRRFFSKYVTALVFKMGRTQWRGLTKEGNKIYSRCCIHYQHYFSCSSLYGFHHPEYQK